jgi:hypothetical protein
MCFIVRLLTLSVNEPKLLRNIGIMNKPLTEIYRKLLYEDYAYIQDRTEKCGHPWQANNFVPLVTDILYVFLKHLSAGGRNRLPINIYIWPVM